MPVGYSSTDSLWEQMEVVRPKLQGWQERFMIASNLIKKGEVTRIGERDFRIPIKLSAGGRYGTYDPNGGDLNRGSSMTGDKLIAPFFPTRMNFELTDLKIDATDNSDVAIKPAFKEAMKDAIPEMALMDDMSFHSDGTALVATATATATVSGTTQYTLDSTFGVNRLRRGMYVTVYASGYGTLRATGAFVKTMDYNAKKATLSLLVPGAGATDVLCYDGVSGLAAPGWKQGLYYTNNSATSGTYYGLDRSLEPEVIANSVNVNGVVTPNHGLILLDQIGKRRGEVAAELIGLANTPQRAQVYTQQIAISEWQRGTADSPMDLLPKARGLTRFPFANVQHVLDYRQDNTRFDWIVPALWGRARLHDVKFYEKGGQRYWPIFGGSGAPSASTWFSLIQNENFYCVDVGAQGFLYGCTAAAGY